MTDVLVAFLKARLDEDEQAARAVGFERIETGEYMWNSKYLLLQGGAGGESKATAEFDGDLAVHIARHDPARTLREVEAKRRIIERHSSHSMGSCRTCERPHWGVQVCDHCERTAPCPDLRDLALPYSDHPEYEEALRS
ncbi:DUF6221 family protein [Streptomyces griseus]|uniref:DUF6221 family protein n=1 Tax=Streptomyces griseus TaxID=1911 RepID=UPI003829E3F1